MRPTDSTRSQRVWRIPLRFRSFTDTSSVMSGVAVFQSQRMMMTLEARSEFQPRHVTPDLIWKRE
ncbi:MAG: hypothetical protein QOJ40_1715 [Verrucomicrobiota bacterium]